MRVVIIAVVLVWAFATDVAGNEITVGRWCDRMLPNVPKYDSILSIVITRDGKVVLKANYGDESSGVYGLRERSGNIYEKIGSTFGDKYRIVPSTGNLQLLDDDGLIRVATRLENTPKSNECSR